MEYMSLYAMENILRIMIAKTELIRKLQSDGLSMGSFVVGMIEHICLK